MTTIRFSIFGLIFAWMQVGLCELGHSRQAILAAEPESAPEWPKSATWLQSDPLTFAQLKGRVVIVHFWTFGCINCQRNYPIYRDWQQRYAKKPVTIIGVHTPEFDSEKDVDRIREQAKKNELKFPILVDNDWKVWKAWRVRYWPSILLVDRHGVVRWYWEGELHLDQPAAKRFADRIDELLAEPEATDAKSAAPAAKQ
ncbi:redoxin domain-containing protein [Tuwongella immobilis]|uniref:Thioredoxin domain-containing protein n=1 Tax=Tuwongella immobilis TaxID=692036 RepID=A0A6C2YNG0_9BACT|nr:redoxin domain-containing protein [Tuwongella immobilis]VIP02924.1 alkyl hydroperoxide reductase thiol specific antioxidant mal allergen : Alkyl hydroperoxide reductase/ Thiol specific antioxidant/ Mal allergen OS=Nostoc sp. PCC 7107 GN=Nos7107_0864 PE=4 SV=1: AhpC-TSA [Tuwongella immobilis]VTS02860.1 alkyl hydroperoxide reductase thiol specific antioxidant mal allergen : Alkyl hydroperoxide reductase/ Thiol specific antioxidant/ Mal allergen OS=Nostoc sp. PCC 7107 GN=Nos7107_0864 PE=4 SV=1: A